MFNIESIQRELRNLNHYHFRVKQNNENDRITNFIYETFKYKEVYRRLGDISRDSGLGDFIIDYGLCRWFNYWSSVGVERIFCEEEGVVPEINPKNRRSVFTFCLCCSFFYSFRFFCIFDFVFSW